MSVLLKSYPLIRPLLFAMPTEAAHRMTLSMLQAAWRCGLTHGFAQTAALSAPRTLMGMRLANPVGLAAGLDKDGAHIDALGSLGFGLIEAGTVTPRAQAGNPRPRLFRLPQAQALINRMGFNNPGLQTFIDNVRRSQWRAHGGILGLNIGKNADTPITRAIDDYLLGLDAVYPHADYVTVNISSPNTKDLRTLQAQEELPRLLRALHARRQVLQDCHGHDVPLVVKIAPDLAPEALDRIAETLPHHGVDGVIATNTTLSRDAVQGLPYANETGGLSGAPVHALALKAVARLRTRLGPDYPIIGAGGILKGEHARAMMDAGAHAVQLYTGLIYRGPELVRECMRALDA